jgi:hypothetical protein
MSEAVAKLFSRMCHTSSHRVCGTAHWIEEDVCWLFCKLCFFVRVSRHSCTTKCLQHEFSFESLHFQTVYAPPQHVCDTCWGVLPDLPIAVSRGPTIACAKPPVVGTKPIFEFGRATRSTCAQLSQLGRFLCCCCLHCYNPHMQSCKAQQSTCMTAHAHRYHHALVSAHAKAPTLIMLPILPDTPACRLR